MRVPDRFNEELQRYEWWESNPSGELELVLAGWMAAEIYDEAVKLGLVDALAGGES